MSILKGFFASKLTTELPSEECMAEIEKLSVMELAELTGVAQSLLQAGDLCDVRENDVMRELSYIRKVTIKKSTLAEQAEKKLTKDIEEIKALLHAVINGIPGGSTEEEAKRDFETHKATMK